MVPLKTIQWVIKVLGSEMRIRIILELFKSPEGIHIRELARKFGITPQSMSEHISILEEHGVVTYRKIGSAKLMKMKNTNKVRILERFLREMNLLK